MKKLYLIIILISSITFLAAQEKKSFIEVVDNVNIEKDLYDFLEDYLKERSLSMIKKSQRYVSNLDDNYGSDKYYDDYVYSNPYFFDDNFYLLKKICICNITYNNTVDEFFKKRGLESIEKVRIKFVFDNFYDVKGNRCKEIKEIVDDMEFSRYKDKILLLYMSTRM